MTKTNFNTNKIKSQSGFSMMELLLVLVVIGVTIASMVAMYSKNSNTNNARQMAQDIQTISSGVKTAFSSDTQGYKTVSNANVVNLGIVPKTLSQTKDGKIKNKFSGDVTIAPGTGSDSDTIATFTIKEENVPKEVLEKAINNLGTDGMVAMSIGTGNCVYSSGAEGSDGASGCSASHAYSAGELAGFLKEISGDNSSITIVYGQ